MPPPSATSVMAPTLTPALPPQAVSVDRAGSESAAPGRLALAGWVALGIGLVTIVAALLAWWVGPGELVAAVAGMAPGWLVLAALLELAALVCLTGVQVATFRITAGRLPFAEAAAVALGSFSLSQLLPAGGAAGGVFATRRLTRRTDGVTAATSVVLAAACSLGMLGAIVTVGGLASAALGTGSATVALVTGAATLLAVIAAVLGVAALRDPARRRRLVAWVATRTGRGPSAQQSWIAAIERQVDIVRTPRRLLPALAWAGAAWTLDVAVLGVVTHAVGVDVPITGILAAYGMANLANAVPLTPGGVGLVEAGLAGTFVAMGVDPGAAAVAALGYRLVGDMFPVMLAGPVLLMTRRAGRAAVAPGLA